MTHRLTALLLVCLCASAYGPVFAQDLKLAANEWPPYVFAAEYRQGVATALATTGLKRAGYELNITIMAWPKVLAATESGDNDVIVAVWYTPARARNMLFSEPYMHNELKLLTRSDVTLDGIAREDLAGLRIGVVKDFAYGQEPYDTTGLDIVVGGSVRDNVRALFARELDLVLGDERVLRHEVDLVSGAKFVRIIPDALQTRGLRIAVSKQRKDHAEIVAAFNKEIAAMREDGSYNSTLANYRISD